MSSVARAAASDGGSLRASTTFWCYECDMSVALVFSSPPLLCPHCHGDFLEEMEEPQRRPSPFHAPHRHRSGALPPAFPDHPDSDLGAADFAATDDLEYFGGAEAYYEVFHRLVGNVVFSASDDHSGLASGSGSGGARRASKSAVEAIPTVQITEAFLAADPFLLCAVCKDEFAVHSEARRLPCRHIYHPDCILPWLSQHNSCPVCRFLLPTEEEERGRLPARADRSRVVFGNLLDDLEEEAEGEVGEIHGMPGSIVPENTDVPDEDEEDLPDIRNILRRIARRRLLLFSRRSRLSVAAAAPSPPTQLEHVEIGSGGLANNPDRVSQRCPRDEITSVGASGTGVGAGVTEEGDVAMSEVGAGGLCN